MTDLQKKGIIVRTDGRSALVSISCKGDECSGCKAALLCSSNKDAVKVTAEIPAGLSIDSGDVVDLNGKLHGWFSGWMLLAGLPCIIILICILAGYLLDLSDISTGLACIASVAVYYLILYGCRGRLERKVEWQVAGKR